MWLYGKNIHKSTGRPSTKYIDVPREPLEPGDFKIMVGSSSKDIRLRGFLKVREND